MAKRFSLLLCLALPCAVLPVLNGQELRVEYPEIRLADKRVLTHAKVDSFNGLSFCIEHDAGLEAFVPWEIMPAVWQSAFPRDPQLAVKIADKARANEAKSPLPPIDLKKHTGVAATPNTAQPVVDEKPAKKTWTREEVKTLLGIGSHPINSEELVKVLGKPDDTSDHGDGSETWIYRNISVDPVTGKMGFSSQSNGTLSWMFPSNRVETYSLFWLPHRPVRRR